MEGENIIGKIVIKAIQMKEEKNGIHLQSITEIKQFIQAILDAARS